ncbi:hypothetical protein HO173_001275 [Letharia columbiana]|uniref:Uncharacterized protein n=1 Tax=Letharia columbiana TaxID=112416 RepID=A0A8H6G4T5_9LECA|nr:uncharacterized protein HO173_001275 [Letharia columbiana]KAF6240604.1 hypothetical protein HO173_001275 [Letharia columbiana]
MRMTSKKQQSQECFQMRTTDHRTREGLIEQFYEVIAELYRKTSDDSRSEVSHERARIMNKG